LNLVACCLQSPLIGQPPHSEEAKTGAQIFAILTLVKPKQKWAEARRQKAHQAVAIIIASWNRLVGASKDVY
jgi:hypothetical protein